VRRSSVERRLRAIGNRLRALREELGIVDEQLAQLDDEADEARIRALVSETELAQREHHSAERHAAAMARRRAEIVDEIERLEGDQDDLLERLSTG
jgi:hypothetical protein